MRTRSTFLEPEQRARNRAVHRDRVAGAAIDLKGRLGDRDRHIVTGKGVETFRGTAMADRARPGGGESGYSGRGCSSREEAAPVDRGHVRHCLR